MSSKDPEYQVAQMKRIVESDRRSEIRLNANGGNSILLVCPPESEGAYIDALHRNLDATIYSIIDLNALLVSFVEENLQSLNDRFDLLRSSIHQVFRLPDGEEGPDLFRHILTAVEQAYGEDRIPVLVHAGALYGSGIDNIHIMEHESVMRASRPLIILYPATHEGEKLMFLNARPSSKYRCMIL